MSIKLSIITANLVFLSAMPYQAQANLNHFQTFTQGSINSPILLNSQQNFQAAPSSSLSAGSSTLHQLKPANSTAARSALNSTSQTVGEQLSLFFNNRKKMASRGVIQPQTGLITNQQIQALNNLQQSNQGSDGLRAYFDQKNGTPSFIQMNVNIDTAYAGRGTDISQSIARAFLSDNSELLKIKNPDQELQLIREDRDSFGKTHLRFQQRINSIPVWGSDAMVHLDNNNSVYMFNGRYHPTPQYIDTTPSVTKEQALQAILDERKISDYDNAQSELNVFYDSKNHPHLAWKIRLNVSIDDHWLYFIDAHQTKVLHKTKMIQKAGQVINASGQDGFGNTHNFKAWSENGQFYLADPTFPLDEGSGYDPINNPKPKGNTLVLDAKNSKQGNNLQLIPSSSNASTTGWDSAGVSAIVNTRIVYDYFKNNHSRDGIDGKQKNFLLITHYDQNLNNAFWNGTAMVFGDGDGQLFSPLSKCLDVTAHEMTHGVIQTSANLKYENQSGALNESYADIFAVLVDDKNWTLGEGCVLKTPFYLRDMKNPNVGLQPQPKKMSEFKNLPNTPQGDNGGVHINSGIPNHAFYMIAEGLGTQSIGRVDAGKIFYRSLTTYLVASSQFIDARRGTLKAAEDLFGKGSKQYNAVAAGWDAVEVSDSSGTSNNTPVPQPDKSSPSKVDSVTGDDLMIYLSPADNTRDYNPNDQYLLYQQVMTNPIGYQQINDHRINNTISASGTVRPIAYTDSSGSFVFFVGSDNNVYAINLATNAQQQITNTGNIWSIALSPDGSYLAYTKTGASDDNIYVYNLTTDTEQSYTVKAPNFKNDSQASLSTVAYADVLSFSYDGKTLIYDALNCLPTQQNPCNSQSGFSNAYTFWSVGIMDVTSGRLQYPFAQLQTPQIDIGNPVFANNNGFVIALDVIDRTNKANTGNVDSSVLTVNFEAQSINTVYNFGSSTNGFVGVPSFWGNDDMLTIQIPATNSTTSNTATGTNALAIKLDTTNWTATADQPVVINPNAVAFPVMHRKGVRKLTGGLQVDSNNLNFGDVSLQQKTSKVLTLSNPGNSDINITNIAITGANASSFTQNATNMLLPKGSTVKVTVLFDAGQTTGTRAANLEFTTDSSTTPTQVSLLANATDGSSSSSGSASAGGGGGLLSPWFLLFMCILMGLLALRHSDAASAKECSN